jgi:cytochrome c oxidase subunit 4
MSDMRGTGDVRRHVRTHVAVFAALMGLTIATVSASSLHVVISVAIAVALILAIVKGSMVAGFFMHVTNKTRIIHWALILTGILLVALMFLPVLTYLDRVR